MSVACQPTRRVQGREKLVSLVGDKAGSRAQQREESDQAQRTA